MRKRPKRWRLPPLPGVDVAQRRRARFCRLAARSTTSRSRRGQTKVGFYGLDLYSLHASIEAVSNYLDRVDPAGAERARRRYACFEDFGQAPQAYGFAAATRAEPDLRIGGGRAAGRIAEARGASMRGCDGRVAEDEYFYAEQNARLIKSAEHYYRTMFRRPSFFLESARRPHGRYARAIALPSRSHDQDLQSASCGLTTRMSGDARCDLDGQSWRNEYRRARAAPLR